MKSDLENDFLQKKTFHPYHPILKFFSILNHPLMCSYAVKQDKRHQMCISGIYA